MSVRKALVFALTTLVLVSGAAFGQGATYSMLNPPQPTDGGGKVEVIEFFWYGCPHCYRLEPEVNAWLKKAPKDVVFKRIPAAPSESWAQMASMFYTLEAMGLLDQFHAKVFDAMHKDNLNLANKKVRDEWLAKQGIDVAKYDATEKSFTVVTKVQRARQLTQSYKVDSVPRLIVNGKYVTSADQAGSAERIFPVVDELIALARKEKTATLPHDSRLARH
ncbi:MAG TPA: thiol:disulfide interchange protein DsbA/DsbL [Usitatibacter sp.]|nr:thiol:disulfide interchange protein DsbA/DsbL [Usitatibacter sp.]